MYLIEDKARRGLPTYCVMLQNVKDSNVPTLIRVLKLPSTDVAELEISQSSALSVEGLSAVANEGALQGLEQFSLFEQMHFESEQATKLIGDILRGSPKLESIRLCACNLTESGFSSADGKAILEQLISSSVRGFNLSGNPLRGIGSLFASKLVGNPSSMLQSLVLNGCELDDDDVIAIADEVEWSSIKELQLAANGFGDRGAETLLNHLASSVVDALDVRQNKLTRAIFPAVTRAFAQRPIPSLRIAGNAGLTNKDVEELNGILQSFSTVSAGQ
jgi:hypothetical protein